MNNKNSIKVVNDQFGSPTWTKDLAELLYTIIETNNSSYGTYHFSGEGQCTWYRFTEEIYQLGKTLGLITSDCSIIPCSSDEFPTLAKRPVYSYLSKEKVKRNFPYIVPVWQDSLNKFLKGINENDII